jgi:hypothetical protein
MLRSLFLSCLFIGTTACGPSFTAGTPPGFVELDDQELYDYRATTPDGLVIAVREIDHEPEGELSFWTRAITNQMREQGGYALLGARDVKSSDGVAGTELRFGHDEGRAPHLYAIAVFVTASKIYLVEAGGTKELMEKHSEQIDWAVRNFRAD